MTILPLDDVYSSSCVELVMEEHIALPRDVQWAT